MTEALTAAGLLIAAGDIWLVVVCWKRRSVLGGIVGVCGAALVAVAIAASPSRGAEEQGDFIAAVALVIGTALYGLGRAFERLLDDGPEDAACDERACRRPEETQVS